MKYSDFYRKIQILIFYFNLLFQGRLFTTRYSSFDKSACLSISTAFFQINLSGISLGSSRSSHRRCSVRNGVLRNFAKFRGKHKRQSLFLIKLQAEACNFIKQETLAQVFSCKFCGISYTFFN